MPVRVQIAFDQSVTQPVNFFTLDDPVRGVLDNTAYALGGDVLVDVTSDVMGVQIRRGRSRQLERFTAGNANVTLRNFGPSVRKYDPLNTAGPYYGSLVPRKQVVIDVDGTPLFTGSVADWGLQYDVSGQSLATPSCTDAFAIVANQTVSPGTQVAELTGTRVGKVLTDIGWPSTSRTISAGQATLDADVIPADTNALTYLSKVADVSEPGALFIGKAGDFVFKSRDQLQAFSSNVTFGTAGIPFTQIDVVYGIEELYNAVSVTYTSGAVVAGTAVASDSTSIAAYGAFDKTYDTLLGSNLQAQNLADWQAATYSQPKYRVNTLTVAYTALSTVQQSQVIGLELGDAVLVDWTPNEVGSPISQYGTIDQIEHVIEPDFHTVTFTLSETVASFTLDSATLGVLDISILGF